MRNLLINIAVFPIWLPLAVAAFGITLAMCCTLIVLPVEERPRYMRDLAIMLMRDVRGLAARWFRWGQVQGKQR